MADAGEDGWSPSSGAAVVGRRRERRVAPPPSHQELLRSLPLRPGDVLVVEEAEGQGEEDDDVCGHDEEAM